MRGSLEDPRTADVLFWQEREMWPVLYHVQESELEDTSRELKCMMYVPQVK